LLFNSYVFIFVFLPLSFFIYFFLLQKRLMVAAKSFLIFASLFFYSWWSIKYLPIILFSILFNYSIGNSINGNYKNVRIHNKSLLIFGITVNIALLGYFKYMDFFIENFNSVFDTSHSLLHLTLPLAISFFTFQQIAYLVDSYRGETSEYNFLNYALFVTFFPQLIAGPIVHHAEMMPQFTSRWNQVKRYKNIATGVFVFSIGLFKKVIIADTLSIYATAGFDHASALNLLEAWATSLSYTFQLYFDFSGYTDMAIGAALLFNIKLPINFYSPYKSLTIQDFWRRWHITLSRFLRDYVYIPLGGNRRGSYRTYSNLLMTFVLGGIWHGAGWTFVLWGFLHGMALVVYRVWKFIGFEMPKIVAWFVTFNFINITWIFFRAKEWKDAVKVLGSMFNFDNIVLPKSISISLNEFNPVFHNINGDKWTVIMLMTSFAIVLFFKNSMQKIEDFKLNFYTLLLSSIAFVVSMLFLGRVSEFLYFNF